MNDRRCGTLSGLLRRGIRAQAPPVDAVRDSKNSEATAQSEPSEYIEVAAADPGQQEGQQDMRCRTGHSKRIGLMGMFDATTQRMSVRRTSS
jgi:hypothetical protein